MEQVIFGGKYISLHTTLTTYNSIVGASTWGPEAEAEKVVSTSGKIKNLRFKLNGSPGAGKHYDFTLMVNGAPSALTLEIADAATSGANTVNEIDVVAGDTVSIECNPDNTPTARYATWTSMFEGATTKESLILGGVGTGRSDMAISPLYCPIMGAGRDTDGLAMTPTENEARQICPTSGTIKNLYVQLLFDPGTAPDAYRFTLRKNGVSQALTVTITADDTTGNDTVNEVTVAAGDVLTLMVEALNEPSSHAYPQWGMTFVADTDGESIVISGEGANPLNAGATEYNRLLSWGMGWSAWDATESQRYQLGQLCTLKKLYVLLSAAPGDGKSYTFTLRKPGNGQADGNLTVTITGAATTTGNDTVNEDAIADDDYVDLKCVPAGTPDVVFAYWGVVGYRAPPVELENKSANMGSKMVGAGLI